MRNMLFPVLITPMDRKTLRMSLIFLNMLREDSKSSQSLKKKNKAKNQLYTYSRIARQRSSKRSGKTIRLHIRGRGVVVHGDARGRLLGFPTANVKVKSTVHLPKEGVYVSEIKIGETWYPAMGSIGHNDTFGEGRS